MSHKIKYIVEQISSKRDTCGNVYHAAIITRTSDGAKAHITTVSDRHAESVAYALLKGERHDKYEQVHAIESEQLGQRDFFSLTKEWEYAPPGNDTESARILRGLFKAHKAG